DSETVVAHCGHPTGNGVACRAEDAESGHSIGGNGLALDRVTVTSHRLLPDDADHSEVMLGVEHRHPVADRHRAVEHAGRERAGGAVGVELHPDRVDRRDAPLGLRRLGRHLAPEDGQRLPHPAEGWSEQRGHALTPLRVDLARDDRLPAVHDQLVLWSTATASMLGSGTTSRTALLSGVGSQACSSSYVEVTADISTRRRWAISCSTSRLVASCSWMG